MAIAYRDLVYSKHFTEPDIELITQIENLINNKSLSAQDKSHLNFSLAKIYDDCKQWKFAFQHYKIANSYIETTEKDKPNSYQIERLQILLNRLSFEERKLVENDTNLPIFIFGMPRSGTTLIAQVLSSHSQVDNAGETGTLDRLAQKLLAKESSYDDNSQLILALKELTAIYLDDLHKRSSSNCNRIIDKTPGNYALLTLSTLLFPNASFIHCVRHPLDTCLSCYFQPFSNMRWSHNINLIAEHYSFYRETVINAQKLLPEKEFFEIQYENFLNKNNELTKALLQYCQLPWESNCLEFYKTKSHINTASVWQVRQPIYRKSIDRWKNYQPYIADLEEALQAYL
jgi:hypothetical protein